MFGPGSTSDDNGYFLNISPTTKAQSTTMDRTDSEATLYETNPVSFGKWNGRASRHHSKYGADSNLLFAELHRPTTYSRVADSWTTSKWCLAISTSSVFVYGTTALVCALLTWFRTWRLADVMLIADNDVVVLITIAGSILMLTALTGMIGTMLNSRPLLAVYVVLLWSGFAAIFVVGRISYRRATFALDRKLNLSWSRYYTMLGRLVIQNTLECCGYYTPLREATSSDTCHPNTMLPGCKGSLYKFEKENMKFVWTVAFSLVPLHTVNIVVGILCANHVTVPSVLARRPGASSAEPEEIQGLVRDPWRLQRPEMSRASSSGMFREDRNV